MRTGIWLTITLACMGLPACSLFLPDRPPTPEEEQAHVLIMQLKQINSGLVAFKGTGRIRFRSPEGKGSFRAYWAGATDGRLRFELRSITGPAVLSLATDGEWLYTLFHARNRWDKRRLRAETALRLPYASIPLKPNDIIKYLVGGVPIQPHRRATVVRTPGEKPLRAVSGDTAAAQELVLTLRQRLGRVSEKVYLRASDMRPLRVELFDRSYTLAYKVIYSGELQVEGYQLPTMLQFSNDQQTQIELRIDKYWANPALSPSFFILEPPPETGYKIPEAHGSSWISMITPASP